MSDRSAKECEDPIPGRLCHIAAVMMHGVDHQFESRIDKSPRLLGVEVFDQLH
jgi:hypothetical protein